MGNGWPSNLFVRGDRKARFAKCFSAIVDSGTTLTYAVRYVPLWQPCENIMSTETDLKLHSDESARVGARCGLLDRAVRTVTSVDRAIGWGLELIVVIISIGLFVLLNYAVFARFVLNASVTWSEELPAFIYACLTFIGAAQLTRTNEHLGFDMLLRKFTPTIQGFVVAANLVLMAAFGVLLAYYGTKVALSFGFRPIVSLDIPVVLFRASMPVGGALIALVCITRLLGLACGVARPGDFLPPADD